MVYINNNPFFFDDTEVIEELRTKMYVEINNYDISHKNLVFIKELIEKKLSNEFKEKISKEFFIPKALVNDSVLLIFLRNNPFNKYFYEIKMDLFLQELNYEIDFHHGKV